MENQTSSSSKLVEFTHKSIDVFKECAGIPSLTRARIFPRGDTECLEIEATWTQMEIERGKRVTFTKSYFLQRHGRSLEKICSSMFQSDATKM